jgi:kumamolisin
MAKARVRLAGSEREPVKDAKRLGPSEPGQTIHVVVTLRRQSKQALDKAIQKMARGEQSEPLTREAFAARFSAAPDDLAKVEAFAKEHGLSVLRADAAACTVTLEGTVERFQQAFGVELSRYEHPTLGHFRGRTGCILLPEQLSGVVTAVLGLDDRPQARPHFRLRSAVEPHRAAGATQTFNPLQIASLYDFPAGDGSGQCIGIVELGGGYLASDLQQYFRRLGVPAPQVVSVGVDGGANAPSGNAGGADGEVALDIEIAGAVAPGAKIAVYFAPNSDAGFIDAVKQAVHDDTNRPTVISISWGAPESTWTGQAMSAFNQALQDAAAVGVTVCAAAGDSGSSDGAASGDSVDFPASSPYVLACGGTRITAAASGASIKDEVVWNDASGGATGGGVSAQFDVPLWQEGRKATRVDGSAEPLAKRGVPDVAADASPRSGYEVLVDGQPTAVGGTSAVAPLFAGLIARINTAQGKAAGFVNPKLYAAATAFRDITQGNNGSFAATSGWDACTGLGSPDGRKIAAALGASGASSGISGMSGMSGMSGTSGTSGTAGG